MPVDLRQDGTVLQFQFADDVNLTHTVRNALLLKVDEVRRQVFEGVLDALRALLEQLHLLVA